MKSSNTSISPFRRVLLAAAVVLATGNAAMLAQSTSSRSSSTNPSSSNSNSNTGSYGSNSNHTSGMSATGSGSDMSSDRSSWNSSSSDNKLSWSDRRFVTKAADGGQEEVALAQLATQKANNPDVRNFAQQLVQDHTQVNSELMSIASSKNVKIDKDDTNGRAYRRLNKASGQDFDREFVAHMIDEHEKDIKMFEKAASDAKDTDVRQFASKHVDHLRQHLTQAQQLQRSIVPTGRSDSGQADFSTSGSSSNTDATNRAANSANAGATGSSSSDMSSGSSAGSTSSSTSSTRY